jgi:hypothetical protein
MRAHVAIRDRIESIPPATGADRHGLIKYLLSSMVNGAPIDRLFVAHKNNKRIACNSPVHIM